MEELFQLLIGPPTFGMQLAQIVLLIAINTTLQNR